MSTAAASRAWALSAAAAVAAAEASVLIAVQAYRGRSSAPFVIALLAVKYPFCWATARRRPGAYLALWLWEATAVVLALAASRVGVVQRGLELSLAVCCLALLAAAAPVFPSPRLPGR